MATAITSLAVRRDAPAVSDLLLAVAVGLFVVLCVELVAAMAARRLGPSGTDVRAALNALTVVAAAGALTARLAAGGDAGPAMAFAVVGVAAACWALPFAAGALVVQRSRIAVSGDWLLVVVATQALASIVAMAGRVEGVPVLGDIGLVVWAPGIVLYVILAPPVAGRLRLLTAGRRFTPDYWILMGALAITTLAAAAILGTPHVAIRPVVHVGALVAWCGATMWIPLLVVLDVRANGPRPGVPGAGRWSMVFPLGMYAAAAQAYGAEAGSPALADVGRWAAWVALASWAAVAVGTGVPAGRLERMSSRRPEDLA